MQSIEVMLNFLATLEMLQLRHGINLDDFIITLTDISYGDDIGLNRDIKPQPIHLDWHISSEFKNLRSHYALYQKFFGVLDFEKRVVSPRAFLQTPFQRLFGKFIDMHRWCFSTFRSAKSRPAGVRTSFRCPTCRLSSNMLRSHRLAYQKICSKIH